MFENNSDFLMNSSINEFLYSLIPCYLFIFLAILRFLQIDKEVASRQNSSLLDDEIYDEEDEENNHEKRFARSGLLNFVNLSPSFIIKCRISYFLLFSYLCSLIIYFTFENSIEGVLYFFGMLAWYLNKKLIDKEYEMELRPKMRVNKFFWLFSCLTSLSSIFRKGSGFYFYIELLRCCLESFITLYVFKKEEEKYLEDKMNRSNRSKNLLSDFFELLEKNLIISTIFCFRPYKEIENSITSIPLLSFHRLPSQKIKIEEKTPKTDESKGFCPSYFSIIIELSSPLPISPPSEPQFVFTTIHFGEKYVSSHSLPEFNTMYRLISKNEDKLEGDFEFIKQKMLSFLENYLRTLPPPPLISSFLCITDENAKSFQINNNSYPYNDDNLSYDMVNLVINKLNTVECIDSPDLYFPKERKSMSTTRKKTFSEQRRGRLSHISSPALELSYDIIETPPSKLPNINNCVFEIRCLNCERPNPSFPHEYYLQINYFGKSQKTWTLSKTFTAIEEFHRKIERSNSFRMDCFDKNVPKPKNYNNAMDETFLKKRIEGLNKYFKIIENNKSFYGEELNEFLEFDAEKEERVEENGGTGGVYGEGGTEEKNIIFYHDLSKEKIGGRMIGGVDLSSPTYKKRKKFSLNNMNFNNIVISVEAIKGVKIESSAGDLFENYYWLNLIEYYENPINKFNQRTKTIIKLIKKYNDLLYFNDCIIRRFGSLETSSNSFRLEEYESMTVEQSMATKKKLEIFFMNVLKIAQIEECQFFEEFFNLNRLGLNLNFREKGELEIFDFTLS